MRVFITGCTGWSYVGGQVLHDIQRLNIRDLKISCLIRDAEKAGVVSAAYPHVNIVQGGFDDTEIIEAEAEAADIVLNLGASGHTASCQAIVEGLKKRKASTNSVPYWIQISGATLFAQKEIAESRFGFPSDLILDDVHDQDKILSIIRENPKRAVDNLAIEQDPSIIKTALIVGPLIYGQGQGPCNRKSIQAPETARVTVQLGHGFKLNEGENIWSNVHVQDLGDLISKVVQAAAKGEGDHWNTNGVFCPEAGEMSFKEMNATIAKEASNRGLIKDGSSLKTIDAKTADELSGHASVLWGTNARTRSSKGNSIGWKPFRSLKDHIAELFA